nr:hypothetical protein [Tanacetum cinerariifolium]
MIVAQQVDEVNVDDVPAAGVADEALEIIKLKQRVKKLERRNKLKGRIIADMDADVDVTLKDVADIAKEVVVDAEIEESTDLITEVANAANVTITAAAPTLTIAAALTLTTAFSDSRRRKGVVIRDPKETATQSTIIHYEAKSKDKGKGILMDYFKGMKYDDIGLIFEKYFNSNVAFLDKTKEQMEEEDNRAPKRIIPNDEDDVYTEATPFAREVSVVDYKIYTENNKPYYKIIRAHGSPQLFLSFLSLLRNFDREDLEVIWELVKERFPSSKPKNFSDDFLLTTLTYMFEKPDVQAQV